MWHMAKKSLTQAEMRERSRSRTSRASRTTTRRTLAEGEEEEPEAEESEQGETEQQQIERYRNSSMEEVSDPETVAVNTPLKPMVEDLQRKSKKENKIDCDES